MNRKNTLVRLLRRNGRGKSAAMAALAAVMAVGSGVVVVAMLPATVQAHSYTLGKIMIGHFWAPPTDQDAKGAAIYGPLLNGGSEPVILLGATTPIADKVRFRIEKDGVESWVNHITLTPNKPMGLAAWRQHIWLSGLKEPLVAGGSFDLNLDFGKAGHKMIQIVIEPEGGH
jgi:copper(I)-binding protein